jgi:hypothetical protein
VLHAPFPSHRFDLAELLRRRAELLAEVAAIEYISVTPVGLAGARG